MFDQAENINKSLSESEHQTSFHHQTLSDLDRITQGQASFLMPGFS